MHWLRLCFSLSVASLALACAEIDGEVLRVPEPSYDGFVATVYPVLLRDCGFPECHGTHERFFQVFGPGRTRLDPRIPPRDPAFPEEIALSFARARSMLASPDLPLLRKPLAVAQGGAGHEGDDAWGQAVYRTRSAPGYLALEAWMRSAGGVP
jgi:hypothetical protein